MNTTINKYAYMKNLYTIMGEQHLIMSFVSDFSREKLASILALVKETLRKPNIAVHLQKRLYAVSVESLDNILKYLNSTIQDNLPIKFSSNLFIITEQDDYYIIKTGSYILNKQKAILQKQIDAVNSLDKEDLKKFHTETLLNSRPEGGGLGIIEMALKTNNKIEYNFLFETEDVSLLVIETKLNK